MKEFLAAAAMALSMAWAAAPGHADESAIQGVIDAQIEAFRGDDFETAFTYAAPNIRTMFDNPDTFGTMVRNGYPMVWQPGTVEYLGAEEDGATWHQDVLITDEAGRLHKLRYTMVETPEGWKIAGVELLRGPEVGA